jgi:AraC-like DNA-binding protein
VDQKFNWSVILSEELKYDYKHLSSLFSSVEGITLEQYIILQKIERVKELLFYDELNINEIADRLGYSSVQHLSTQFKKITGSTPTAYKKSYTALTARKGLDSV